MQEKFKESRDKGENFKGVFTDISEVILVWSSKQII